MPSEDGRAGRCCAVLVLLGLAVYANSFAKVFALDDFAWIVHNPALADVAASAWQMIGRPVVGVTLHVNYVLGGHSVGGYHAVNLAIHVGAALALFGVVHRTLRLPRWGGRYDDNAEWLALAVAAVWLVHPLQTQAVTYIIQRCESLMGLFYLLTLYAAIRAVDAPRPGWWGALAVAAAALGMGCKEVMATAPLLVVLYDWTFLEGGAGDILRRRWKLYAGLFATWGVLVGCLLIPRPVETNVGFGLTHITPLQYLLTQAGVLVHYLRLALWPSGLCFVYRDWSVAQNVGDVLAPGVAVVLLLLATLVGLARRSAVGFLGAWFFVILAPTSSVMPIIDVAFEHRMYLPLAAVVALVVLGLERLTVGMWPRRLAAVAACVVVAALAVLTVRRNEDYRSLVALWEDTQAKQPGLWSMREVGLAYSGAGRWRDARDLLLEADRLQPGHAPTLDALGRAHLYGLGDATAAAEYLRRALPRSYTPGGVHHHLALALRAQGDVAGAARHWQEAVALWPDRPDFRFWLGGALCDLGDKGRAAEEFARAVELAPGLLDAMDRQARLTALAGGTDPVSRQLALAQARACCQASDFRRADLLDTLALALAAAGRADEAAGVARRGLDRARQDGDRGWVVVLERRVKQLDGRRAAPR